MIFFEMIFIILYFHVFISFIVRIAASLLSFRAKFSTWFLSRFKMNTKRVRIKNYVSILLNDGWVIHFEKKEQVCWKIWWVISELFVKLPFSSDCSIFQRFFWKDNLRWYFYKSINFSLLCYWLHLRFLLFTCFISVILFTTQKEMNSLFYSHIIDLFGY